MQLSLWALQRRERRKVTQVRAQRHLLLSVARKVREQQDSKATDLTCPLWPGQATPQLQPLQMENGTQVCMQSPHMHKSNADQVGTAAHCRSEGFWNVLECIT
jgi:hypothetical protein